MAAAYIIPTISTASAELGIKMENTAVVVADDPEAVMERLVDVLRACKAAFSRSKQKPFKVKALVVEDHDYTEFTVKLLAVDDKTFVLDLFVSDGRAVMAKAFFKKAVECVLTNVSPAPFDLSHAAGYFRVSALHELPALSLEQIEHGLAPIVSGLSSAYLNCQKEAALTACRLLSKPHSDGEVLLENNAAQSPALFDALCDSLITSDRRVGPTVKAIASRALSNAFYHSNSVAFARFLSRFDALADSLASILILTEDQDDLCAVWSKRSVVQVFLHLKQAKLLFSDAVTAAVLRCFETTDDVILSALCKQFLDA
jgi:hypothetical protein